MHDINEQSVEISCWNCGVEGVINIGLLRSIDRIDCTRCGTTNGIDSDQLNRRIKSAQKKLKKRAKKAMRHANGSSVPICWESVISWAVLLIIGAALVKKCILFLFAQNTTA